MAKTFNIPFIFAIAVTGALALQQQITIYELPSQQGNSVSFTGKYADLSNYTSILNTAQSYCSTGWFYFYDLEDFTYEDSYFNSLIGINFCGNHTFGSFKSGRIIGPADFYSPALSIFEGRSLLRGGQEIIVTSGSSTNFEFLPASVASFGNSSWTLFTENNFEGGSWCFEAGNDALGHNVYNVNSTFPVRSVIKGCDPADIQYHRNLYA